MGYGGANINPIHIQTSGSVCVNRCWLIIEKQPGYQSGSMSGYQIIYLLVLLFFAVPDQEPTQPGISVLDTLKISY
jgi:hypothetical protein